MVWELDVNGQLVDRDTIVCAGWCGRRGPQVTLITKTTPITCAACRKIEVDGYPIEGL